MSEKIVGNGVDIEGLSAGDREVLGAVVGLAKTCGNNPYTDDTVKLMCEALSKFDRVLDGGEAYDTAGAAHMVEELHREKYKVSPSCAVCQARCGNTDDYDISLILNEDDEKIGIKAELIYAAVMMAKAAVSDNGLRSDDDFRLVFTGALTVLSYEMSVKGLENAVEQTKKYCRIGG